MPREDFRPIFVVGSPRSGTSATVLALKEGGKLPGYNEGHLVTLLGDFIAIADRHYHRRRRLMGDERHLLANVPRDVLVGELVDVFEAHYVKLHGSPRFFEKTGDEAMIRMSGTLQEIWPATQFVFAKRRGIENIMSRIRKFPEVDFETHCKRWAGIMIAWSEVRGELRSTLEVDQADMLARPEMVAEQLGEFLELSAEQIAGMAEILGKRRPQRTTDADDDAPALTLDATGWDEGQKAHFRTVCGPAMELFGYDL